MRRSRCAEGMAWIQLPGRYERRSGEAGVTQLKCERMKPLDHLWAVGLLQPLCVSVSIAVPETQDDAGEVGHETVVCRG